MVDALQTPRLQLRPITMEDVDRLFQWTSDRAAMATSAAPPETQRQDTETRVRGFVDHWSAHGHGPWMLWTRDAPRCVGMCGVYALADVDIPCLAYLLDPSVRGHGLATEAAQACLQHALHTVGLPRVAALVLPANTPSIRVLMKLGFAPMGSVQRRGQPTLRFEWLR